MSIKFTDRMCYLFKVTVVCSLLSLLYSCVKTANKTDYENLKRISAEVQIPVSLICKDTLVVDARETSMQGYWKVIDNQLCFTDEHIVRVIIYDTLGKKLNSIFMQGRGPREFTSPALSFFQLSNGKYLYADKNQNLYILSSSPEYTKEVHTNVITAGLPKKNVDNFINDLLANPDPNNYAMYELCFQGYDFIEYNDDILFPVTTDHVSFNGYFSKYAKDFYSQSFTIMAVDKKKSYDI